MAHLAGLGGTYDPSFWRETVDDFLAEGAGIDLVVDAERLALHIFIACFA
jgi:hypothetical protein